MAQKKKPSKPADRNVLVLLSGGLDSTVLAAHLQEEHGFTVHGLSIFYGQLHRRENESARAVAKDLQLKSFQFLPIPDVIYSHAESPLVNKETSMPHESYEDLRKAVGPSPTYVPFRNGLMISIAAAYAMSRHMDAIALASHADDAHNWAYPDCTPEFNEWMGKAIHVGTYEELVMLTPFQNFTKAEIVAEGLKLGVPFHLTWTCYDPKPDACGQCPSCVSRLEAFAANDTPDPVHYVRRD